MGSFYTTEQRIERIERYLGINDTTRIDWEEWNTMRMETLTMINTLNNLKKEIISKTSDLNLARTGLDEALVKIINTEKKLSRFEKILKE